MPSIWDKIATGSQVVAALSTAAVAGLAIYGIFFTDLPERLVAQLRSEITEAKFELTELQRTNRSLVTESRELVARNSAIQAEVDLREQELKRLSTTKKSLEHELEKIQEERASYFNETARVVIRTFFTDLSNTLSELEVRAAQARDIPGAEKLLQYDLETTRVDVWLAHLPKSWNVFPLVFVNKKIIEDFKNEITYTDNKSPITAFKILSGKLDGEKFFTLLPDDRKRLFDKVFSYMRANPVDFSAPLEIIMPRGWTYDDLPSAYSRVSRAQQRVREHLTALEIQVTP